MGVYPIHTQGIQTSGLTQPFIQTSGTTNVYYGVAPGGISPEPTPELGPLDWLRGQVDEICDLAMSP